MALLTRDGYVVDYDDFDESHQDELTVTQEVSPYFNNEAQTFEVFVDRHDGTISVPRYWGSDTFGRPVHLFGNTQTARRLAFKGELRSEIQQNAASASLAQLRNHGGGVLSLYTGLGKCHGIDTPILMYNGDIKMVQNVKIGDFLMGDDSTPREVLSLARGMDEMYDIIPVKGDKYTVNQEHILVLKNTGSGPTIRERLLKNETQKYDVYWWENFKITSMVHDTVESAEAFAKEVIIRHQSVVEISVRNYLKQSKAFKHHFKGYRTAIHFADKHVPIDPYMIGIWLGDGNSRKPQITSQDGIIIDYFVSNLRIYGLYLTKLKDRYGYGIRSTNRYNEFMETLRNLDLIMNKHIPTIYKCNSRRIRLRLLAGILDSDGSLTHDGCSFDLLQKSEKLIDDIIYLCRSLGFSCYKSKQQKGCWYKNVYVEKGYYRITISGNGVENIPTLIHNKKAAERRQIKDNLVTGIEVHHTGLGNYYGFTLDGNSRYVLGDFTVTHNTVIALYIACCMKIKTLVVVHKSFLLDQWEERIKTFVPLARIGRVQQNVEDVDGCDIVVGMLQSIAMREYDDETFRDFGLVIFDEVHVVPAPVFSRALLRLSAPYMLGLSATPVRRDGLSYVIHWFIGPIFFEHSLTEKDDVTVKVCSFQLGRTLPMNMVAATTILCAMEPRNTLIVKLICELTSIGHKVLLLSDRRAHCQTLKTMLLLNANIEGALYLGGMKGFELKESEKRAVLLGTYSLAKEGLDIPSLDAVVLATPRSDVVQACGRILHGKTAHSPIIIDIVDQWIIGRAQFNKRKIYYDKAGFTVVSYNQAHLPNAPE